MKGLLIVLIRRLGLQERCARSSSPRAWPGVPLFVVAKRDRGSSPGW